MKKKTFAAIDVGSHELAMKIFEVSPQTGLKVIDHVRHSLDIGTESYKTGKLSYEHMEELCHVLREFTLVMRSYKVEDYCAYGTSAIRELDNTIIVLDQIEKKTGIKVQYLSNSEQRFLDYKSIAAQGEDFYKIISSGTAILDIGGGSIQVSLFDKDALVATQNIRLGVLRLYEKMRYIDVKPSQYQTVLAELIDTQLAVFKKLYLKDREIKNLIVVDDYVSAVVKQVYPEVYKKGYIERKKFLENVKLFQNKNDMEVAGQLNMAEENVPLLHISSQLIKSTLEFMGADCLWVPGVTLCDGIGYDYAERNKWIKPTHDFEEDIIACAKNISKRYQGSKRRGETLEKICLTVFDSMKKIHGLGKRERLLLQIATLLHDCGKYVNMVSVGECSYHIVMNTEIIGLSHLEREMVANIVKYNHEDFAYYDEIAKDGGIDKDAYLVVAKLTSILRVANGLDKTHKQKFKDIKTTIHENELWIQVDTAENIALEKGLFWNAARFFEEVYNIKPVIRQKRTV
ncbi:MAG: HD domain-containing protein [Lachnospiraceae bacterium]|nr:HD domain-containing protein [Lachnospiraceae bacterium]